MRMVRKAAVSVLAIALLCGCGTNSKREFSQKVEIAHSEYLDSQSADGLTWRIVDNFRLFGGQHSKHLMQLAVQSRKLQDVVLDRRDFPANEQKTGYILNNYDEGTDRYGRNINSTLHPKEDYRILPVENYAEVEEWKIELSLEPNAGKCKWQVDGRVVDTESCTNVPLRVLGDSDGVVVSVRSGTHVEAKTVDPVDRVILSLGDSYASGEGVGKWVSKRCHRSMYSWPTILAARYALENPHESVTFLSRACSGATIRQLIDLPDSAIENYSEEGWRLLSSIEKRPIPAQLPAAVLDLCGHETDESRCATSMRQVDIVLVSIGGNDAQFSDVVRGTFCPNSTSGALFDEDSVYEEKYKSIAESALTQLRNDYLDLADEIFHHFPLAKVYMTNYPNPLRSNSGELCTSRDLFDGFLGAVRSFFQCKASSTQISSLERFFIEPFSGTDGLLKIGENVQEYLEKKYPGTGMADRWNVVDVGRFTDELNSTAGIPISGYCSRGEGLEDRWFLTLNDSTKLMSDFRGMMHPNLFGQLYYVNTVYPEIRF